MRSDLEVLRRRYSRFLLDQSRTAPRVLCAFHAKHLSSGAPRPGPARDSSGRSHFQGSVSITAYGVLMRSGSEPGLLATFLFRFLMDPGLGPRVAENLSFAGTWGISPPFAGAVGRARVRHATSIGSLTTCSSRCL
jgi:hypothetical protein